MRLDILNPLIKMLQMVYLVGHYLLGPNFLFLALGPWAIAFGPLPRIDNFIIFRN